MAAWARGAVCQRRCDSSLLLAWGRIHIVDAPIPVMVATISVTWRGRLDALSKPGSTFEKTAIIFSPLGSDNSCNTGEGHTAHGYSRGHEAPRYNRGHAANRYGRELSLAPSHVARGQSARRALHSFQQVPPRNSNFKQRIPANAGRQSPQDSCTPAA